MELTVGQVELQKQGEMVNQRGDVYCLQTETAHLINTLCHTQVHT